jgi:hypothetical protein
MAPGSATVDEEPKDAVTGGGKHLKIYVSYVDRTTENGQW